MSANCDIKHENPRECAISKIIKLGERLFEEGKYEDAAQIFMQMSKIAPENHENWNNLAVAYMYKELNDKAEECLKISLSIKRNYPDALENLKRLKGVAFSNECAIDPFTADIKKQLKIGFIQVTNDVDVQWFRPLSFGYLKAYLDNKLKSPVTMEFLESSEDMKHYDIVALSATSQNYARAMEIASEVKQLNRDIITILGGHHVTYLPESLSSDIDLGVLGEGEQTFLELVEHLQINGLQLNTDKLGAIKGIAYWEDGNLKKTEKRELISPLDSIPHPHRGEGGAQYIFTSRGCPYKCSFCSSTAFWNKTRFFSAEYVVEEIEQILDRFPENRHIHIWDDLFIANIPRLLKIIELLEEKGLADKLTFAFAVRANLIDDEMCRILKRLKVGISFGAESGSDRILKLMRKGTTVKQNQKALDLIYKYGFSVMCSFIVGWPGETEEEVHETYNFILKNIRDQKLPTTNAVNILMPIPGTEVWNSGVENGHLDLINFDWNRLSLFTSYRDSNVRSFDEWVEIRRKKKSLYLANDTLPQERLYAIMHEYVKVFEEMDRIKPEDRKHYLPPEHVLWKDNDIRYLPVKKNTTNLWPDPLPSEVIARLKKENFYRYILSMLNKRERVFNTPLEIFMETSNACNLRCTFCATRALESIPSGFSAIMSPDIMRSISPFLKGMASISLHGFGEPLLNKYTIKAAVESVEFMSQVDFFTNGMLLNESIVRALVKANIPRFTVSISSADPELYEKLYAKGSFEKLIKNLRLVKEEKERCNTEHPVITFNAIAMRDTIQGLPELVRLAAELGVIRIELKPMVIYPNMEHMHDQRITYDEKRDSLSLLTSHELAKKCGVILVTSIYEATKHSECKSRTADSKKIKQDKEALDKPCPLVFRTIYIRSDGKVKPCCFASDENRLSLGDVAKQTIHEIWNGEKYQALRRSHIEGRVPPACAHCVEFNLAPPSDSAQSWLMHSGIEVYDPHVFMERLTHAEKILVKLRGQFNLLGTIKIPSKKIKIFDNNLRDSMNLLKSLIEFSKEYRNAVNILRGLTETFREVATSVQKTSEVIEFCLSCTVLSEINNSFAVQLLPLIDQWFELLEKARTSLYECIKNQAKCA